MSNQKLPTARELVASPASSVWLKRAVLQALNRDPVKVAAEAELLARVLAARADALIAIHAGLGRIDTGTAP